MRNWTHAAGKSPAASWLVAAILVALLLLPAALEAQQTSNPANQSLFYTFAVASSKSYASSQKDTLPGGTNGPGVKIGGASLASLTVTVNDTASLDIFVDKKTRGTSTWTNILTDSLINTGTTSNSGKIQEYLLRDNSTEKIAGVDVVLRTRTAFRASGNGTSSATYTEKFNYKP